VAEYGIPRVPDGNVAMVICNAEVAASARPDWSAMPVTVPAKARQHTTIELAIKRG